MTDTARAANLLAQLEHLNEQQLRRLLVEHLTKQKLGLYWEANAIERDAALNADLVLPRLVEEWSCANVGRVSPSGRNPTSGFQAGSNVGLRDEAANPTLYLFTRGGYPIAPSGTWLIPSQLSQ